MGLFRKAIIVGAVAMLAPTSPDEALQDANSVLAGTFRAVDIVMMTVRDVSGFCGRNPAICGGDAPAPGPRDIRAVIEAGVDTVPVRDVGPQDARRISPAPAAPLR